MQGVTACFKAWLEQRGGIGSQEERVILEQVRHFFQSHCDSRFNETSSSGDDAYTIPVNRAGFRKKQNGETVYLVFSEVFKSEIAKGYIPKNVAKVCINAGCLLPSSDGKSSTPMSLPGIKKRTRVYIFTSTVLGGE